MEIKIPPNHKKRTNSGGNEVENLMAKIQKDSQRQGVQDCRVWSEV